MFTETERDIMGDVYRYLKAWYDRPMDGQAWENAASQAADLSAKYHGHPLAVHMLASVVLFLEEQQEGGSKD